MKIILKNSKLVFASNEPVEITPFEIYTENGLYSANVTIGSIGTIEEGANSSSIVYQLENYKHYEFTNNFNYPNPTNKRIRAWLTTERPSVGVSCKTINNDNNINKFEFDSKEYNYIVIQMSNNKTDASSACQMLRLYSNSETLT